MNQRVVRANEPVNMHMWWKSFVSYLSGGMDHSDRRLFGLRVSMLGFLVLLCGVALFWLDFQKAGNALVKVGMVVGVLGIVLQFVLRIAEMKRGRNNQNNQGQTTIKNQNDFK